MSIVLRIQSSIHQCACTCLLKMPQVSLFIQFDCGKFSIRHIFTLVHQIRFDTMIMCAIRLYATQTFLLLRIGRAHVSFVCGALCVCTLMYHVCTCKPADNYEHTNATVLQEKTKHFFFVVTHILLCHITFCTFVAINLRRQLPVLAGRLNCNRIANLSERIVKIKKSFRPL